MILIVKRACVHRWTRLASYRVEQRLLHVATVRNHKQLCGWTELKKKKIQKKRGKRYEYVCVQCTPVRLPISLRQQHENSFFSLRFTWKYRLDLIFSPFESCLMYFDVFVFRYDRKTVDLNVIFGIYCTHTHKVHYYICIFQNTQCLVDMKSKIDLTTAHSNTHRNT